MPFHVDQLTLRKRFLVERTYTVDDFSRTIAHTYRFELLPHGARSRFGGFVVPAIQRKLLALVMAASDGLLDLVCQRCSHFTQRAHTIGMGQIGPLVVAVFHALARQICAP